MSEPNINELADDHNIDQGESILLCVERDEWVGICGPEVDGHSHEDAPHTFEYDTQGDTPSDDEVALAFTELYDERVEEVLSDVRDKDEPMEAIRDMSIENMISE